MKIGYKIDAAICLAAFPQPPWPGGLREAINPPALGHGRVESGVQTFQYFQVFTHFPLYLIASRSPPGQVSSVRGAGGAIPTKIKEGSNNKKNTIKHNIRQKRRTS